MSVSTSLKLVSLNIEGHRHLDKIIPFLQAEQPDVVCLQEVFEVDFPTIKHALNMEGQYLPMADVNRPTPHQSHHLGSWGLAQFSRLPIVTQGHEYYVKIPTENGALPEFFAGEDPNHIHRVVAWIEVEQADSLYRIATTHFTWSTAGEATPEQLEHIEKVIAITQSLGEVVICGDFNAPRGRATFERMAQVYTDNIPPEVTSTIDASLHKSGKEIPFVVDVLFSTPQYRVSDVKVVDKVSDHKAIVASIAAL